MDKRDLMELSELLFRLMAQDDDPSVKGKARQMVEKIQRDLTKP